MMNEIGNKYSNEELAEAFKKLFKSPEYEALQESMNEITESVKRLVNSIDFSYIESFSNAIKKDYENIFSNLAPALEQFKEALSKLSLPGYTEEEKNRIINNYVNFGKYGWSLPPDASFYELDVEVNDQKEADKYIINNYYKNDIDNLLTSLFLFKIRKEDLKEAVSCYKNKEYRACAMIVYSLIDNKLIITQKIRGEDYISVGNGAIYKQSDYKKAYQKKGYECKLFALNGVVKCLETFYESDHGFNGKFNLCNRNHLIHGRYAKKVTKLDCIKLFNLLWGVYLFL